MAISSVEKLINLGMSPELAAQVIAVATALNSPIANNTYVTFEDAAGTGTVSVLKVDATDDTVLNAKTGELIKLSVNGTAEVTIGDNSMTFSGASFSIIPGATAILFRNNANDASNLTISDAGLVTARAGLVATTGNIANTAGFNLQSVAAAVVAAGSTIADATALTAVYNKVATVGSGEGVKLPEAAVGAQVVVQNGGANDLEVYPPDASEAINAASVGDPITLAAATDQIMIATKVSATLWVALVGAGPAT